MYKKILVAMALDHHVSPKLLAFAKANCTKDGSITALHVIEEPSGTANARLREDLQNAGLDQAAAIFKEKLADHPEISSELLQGHASRTIAEYADQINADCIVMGSHKPGLADYFIGSTASRVVRHANCSVHVFRDT
jgi:nucleotide-binding universal stress UspA family protein